MMMMEINREFMSELYSFSKATRFFSKPLYQTSPYAIPVLLRMVNLNLMIQKHFL